MTTERQSYDQLQFRVWPDGTTQCVDDGPAHSHLSDDYFTVWAYDEEDAAEKVERGTSKVETWYDRLLLWAGFVRKAK